MFSDHQSETMRKALNSRQTTLRQMLTDGEDFQLAIELFLSLHAMLHSMQMAGTQAWSFEDQILDGMPEADIRRIPGGEEHSIAWVFWHITRIEDVAMNLLVAGKVQILFEENWQQRLAVADIDTGNEIPGIEIARLSAGIDIQGLRLYRQAVGRRTREIVQQLNPADLKTKVDPLRLERVWQEKALLPEAAGIAHYWGGRTIAGLLLMPASRHIISHLNEALTLKHRRQG